jgi:hypothetical protein
MPARRATVLLLLCAACEQAPIEWQEPAAIPEPPPGWHLTVDAHGQAAFTASSVHIQSAPADVRLCRASLQTAEDSGRSRAVIWWVWWSVRSDSSAILYAASSADAGRSWGVPAPIDTSDVSSRGCSRPAPSITMVGSDLYVAYSMIAPEGTGVFFAHTMASVLHSPVAVIYGERLVSTAIAADSQRVVVAYEEPNGKRDQIDVALSSTQGHIFEEHLTATRDVDVAVIPSVALADHELAVAWTARPFRAGAASHVVRVGRLK